MAAYFSFKYFLGHTPGLYYLYVFCVPGVWLQENYKRKVRKWTHFSFFFSANYYMCWPRERKMTLRGPLPSCPINAGANTQRLWPVCAPAIDKLDRILTFFYLFLSSRSNIYKDKKMTWTVSKKKKRRKLDPWLCAKRPSNFIQMVVCFAHIYFLYPLLFLFIVEEERRK